MQLKTEYDVAIIGGGLAGLAASIQLARKGYGVIVFEKEKFPFHKVCGEYVSMESWNFLTGLGVPLAEMNLPKIDTLFLTAPSGKSFTTKLPLGGFGISRYLLDSNLAAIARQNGVHVVDQTKVDDVTFEKEFIISFQSKKISSRICLAAWGKRSNIDIKWKRDFLKTSNNRLDNYIAVKYHMKTYGEENVIGLHNFKDGYCGISKIEEGKYCLCYMTTARNLKGAGNDILRMQEKVLHANPHIKKIFSESEVCNEFPITISQINFSNKAPVENHVLMLGDAAGMITPLCGNGMSIALHTSKIAAALGIDVLSEKISMSQMEDFYRHQWTHHFSGRLKTGRRLQHFFGSDRLNNLFVSTFKTFPFLSKPVIKMTHGKPF